MIKLYLFIFSVFICTPAFSITIESVFNDFSVPINTPIIIKEDGRSSEHELFEWVGDEGVILGRGPVFIPKSQNLGGAVKLCIENICSNNLTVVDEIDSAPNYWSIKDKITNYIINKTTSSFEVTTMLEVDGGRESIFITSSYYALKSSSDGEYITPYLKYPYSYPITESTLLSDIVKYNDIHDVAITLCSVVTFSSGDSPYFHSDKCDTRIVYQYQLEDSLGFIRPPSKEQYNVISRDEEVPKNYYGPYTASTEPGDLHNTYCRSISPLAYTMNNDMLSDFINSSYFDRSWPGVHGYWSNEKLGEIYYSVTSFGDGKGTANLAPDDKHKGYYSCKIKDRNITLGEWSYNYSKETPSGSSSVYFIVPNQISVKDTNAQRTRRKALWSGAQEDTTINVSVYGDDGNEYMVNLIGNKRGPYSFSNMRIEDGLQRGYGEIKLTIDKDHELYQSLPSQSYNGLFYIARLGWHDEHYQEITRVPIHFTKKPFLVSLSISYPYSHLHPRDSMQGKAVATFSDYSIKDVTEESYWKSSHPAPIDVNQKGVAYNQYYCSHRGCSDTNVTASYEGKTSNHWHIEMKQ